MSKPPSSSVTKNNNKIRNYFSTPTAIVPVRFTLNFNLNPAVSNENYIMTLIKFDLVII